MDRIGIVVPTVVGREEHLERCLNAYIQNTDGDFAVIQIVGAKTCAAAWNIGAKDEELADCDYLHFTADDLEPMPGWDEAAIAAIDEGVLPAPRMFTAPEAAERGCVDQGDRDENTVVEKAAVPFLSREMWDAIGPCLDVHYFSDDWITWRASRLGWPTRWRSGYAFTHHWAVPGRGAGMTEGERVAHDLATFRAAVSG